MKPFAFHTPHTLAEAVELLDGHGESARPIAGGQSLLLAMKERLSSPSVLVSLADIAELGGFSTEPDGALVVGATSSYAALSGASFTGWQREICSVAGDLADRPVRAMGTIGGALCQADARFDMPALCVGLDASVGVVSSAGSRPVATASLFAPSGGTILGPGELLTRIVFPPAERFTGAAFEKFRYRQFDAALVSAVCAVKVSEDGTVSEARLAFGAIAPAPVLATTAAAALHGSAPTGSDIAEIAEHAVDEVLPASTDAPPLHRYQRELAKVLGRRVIGRALDAECVQPARQ